MLKLFLIEEGEEEEDKSSRTPNSLNLPTSLPLRVAQVLELWPIFPQCEHFLAIIANTNYLQNFRLREKKKDRIAEITDRHYST
jgi:hypothetical protein